MLSGPWQSLSYCTVVLSDLHFFEAISKPLVPSCGRSRRWFYRSRSQPLSQPLSPLVPYFNWPGFVPLLCCNEKARGASRLKILSASPRSNSHNPKLGPLYKVYCLKLSRNKKFKRPGCFNALQWIIKKYAFPDNGEGNFNTFGCKFIEETLWHIFVWGLYMTLSCILISLCKEMVKYSSGHFALSFSFMLDIENEQDHFLKKQKTCTNGTCAHWGPALKRNTNTANLIHIHINAVWGRCQYKAINILHYEQGHSIEKHAGLNIK